MSNWEINTIDAILPEEFFALIERNRRNLVNTFPVTISGCSNLERTAAFLAQGAENQEKGEYYYFYLRDTQSKKLIGYIVVKNINRYILKCELGYFVDKDYQGRGITSKIVAKTVAFCFDTLHLNKVYICTSPVNFASQKVALKNGFIQEGVLKQEFKNGDGVIEDIFYFGLLKSEYGK